MEHCKGMPFPMGTAIVGDSVNFSTTAASGKKCFLLLYKKGGRIPSYEFEMKEEFWRDKKYYAKRHGLGRLGI